MTTDKKRKALIELCHKYPVCSSNDGCPLQGSISCRFSLLTEDEIDSLYDKAFPESEPVKSDNSVVTPNYEAEYHRLSKENAQLRVENYRLKTIIIGMCKKFFFEEDEE